MFVVVEYVGQLPQYCGEAVQGFDQARDVTTTKRIATGSVFLGE